MNRMLMTGVDGLTVAADATARARWGPQSWNEMYMGFVDVAKEPPPADPAVGTAAGKGAGIVGPGHRRP